MNNLHLIYSKVNVSVHSQIYLIFDGVSVCVFFVCVNVTALAWSYNLLYTAGIYANL